MKKAVCLLIALALVLTLPAGCGEEAEDAPETTGYTAVELAAALIASQSEPPEFYYVTQDDSVFAAYAALYLGAELAGDVRSGAICYPVGPLASEAAVFELGSPESARRAPEHLSGYIDNRVAAFFGYAPEESELASNGQVRVLGRFAVLYILADTAAADEALEDAFSDEAPAPPDIADYAAPLRQLEEPEEPEEPDTGTDEPEDTQPPPPTEPEGPEGTQPPPSGEPEGPEGPEDTGEPERPGGPEDTGESNEPDEPDGPDEYDHDRVLAALRGETDPAGLTPKNLAVYNAAAGVLDEIITPDMTDYDKELAVNDYLVFHAQYDPAELTSGPVGTPDPDNDNPYGLLVDGLGICLGYTTTFQLFMDALEIRCLTVHGFAHGWEEDHAWNLVCLEGDWYAVDVTWNDPVFTGWRPTRQQRLLYAREYFNVTSQYLRDTGHFWSEDVPEAEGTRWAFQG